MSKVSRKFLYRSFCLASFLVAMYMIVDLNISRTLDIKMGVVFLLLIVAAIWGIVERGKNDRVIHRQEEELKMYRLYIQPLEGLVKDIRAKQHEFDNHMNAILNMHITIHSYEELVEKQSQYIKETVSEDVKQLMPLLKISDKVLAGFLYSKLVNAKKYVQTELRIRTFELISGISEHGLIEIVGILVDNAYEACTSEHNRIIIILDSQKDKLVFEIKNQFPKVSIDQISKFFEAGYSTKIENLEKHGFGLHRAKILAEKFHGEITVGQETIQNKNYIHFKVIL